MDKLCSHLPRSLTDQCTDFVKSYSKELVEMLLADLSPQEVCAYLHLCDPTKDPGPKHVDIKKDEEIRELFLKIYMQMRNREIYHNYFTIKMFARKVIFFKIISVTNEIPEYPLHVVQPTNNLDDGVCIICEFAMQYIDKAIGNQKTRDKIEKAVHSVCNHLPKTVANECNTFVDQYADVLISILSQEVTPKEACTVLGLCKVSMIQIQGIVIEIIIMYYLFLLILYGIVI